MIYLASIEQQALIAAMIKCIPHFLFAVGAIAVWRWLFKPSGPSKIVYPVKKPEKKED